MRTAIFLLVVSLLMWEVKVSRPPKPERPVTDPDLGSDCTFAVEW